MPMNWLESDHPFPYMGNADELTEDHPLPCLENARELVGNHPNGSFCVCVCFVITFLTHHINNFQSPSASWILSPSVNRHKIPVFKAIG